MMEIETCGILSMAFGGGNTPGLADTPHVKGIEWLAEERNVKNMLLMSSYLLSRTTMILTIPSFSPFKKRKPDR